MVTYHFSMGVIFCWKRIQVVPDKYLDFFKNTKRAQNSVSISTAKPGNPGSQSKS